MSRFDLETAAPATLTPLHDLAPGETLPGQRAGMVVCIPLYGAHHRFTRCLSSVLEHTPPDVPILVADDAGPDPASRAWVEALALRHRIYWLRQPENLGFVANANRAFAAAAPHDVVLVNSDCAVAEGWLEGLRDAAYADSIIATATALTNCGTIVSVPYRNHPMPELPQDLTLDEAARRVRERSPRLRPRIPTMVGHCVYIRRMALDLVGGFDETFSPAYGEEVDFSQRCLLRGLQHVVADDVLVYHAGGSSLSNGDGPASRQIAHERVLRNRYPYYQRTVESVERDETGPLARTLRVARRALLGPSVTVDGRCLWRFLTGTQLHALEVIHALWRTEGVRLRVILPADPGDYALETLNSMNGVELLPVHQVGEHTHKTDIVHCPFQVTSAEDLLLLRKLGERAVITHHDLILYRNPGYHPSHKAWRRHQRLTRHALALADLVVFVSGHAANDAVAEELVAPDRARVVHNGVDHRLGSLRPPSQAPADGARIAERPYLLCLGTDFRHKNRVFALRMLAALKERHGWDGRLVLAGPHIARGSSAGEEAEWLALHPEMADSVVTLPAIEEAEKWWLYEHAAAVVYPSTYEGFGLIPFEAAALGVPCLLAPVASLPEVLPDELALLVPWDPAASADRAIEVLRDPARREAFVAGVRREAEKFTWDRTAAQLVSAYEEAAGLPSTHASHIAREALALDDERGSWEGRYWHLRNAVGGTGMSLVGPDARLPEDAQRALAALTNRRATRAPLVATLRAIHRLARVGRANGRRPAEQSTLLLDEPEPLDDGDADAWNVEREPHLYGGG